MKYILPSLFLEQVKPTYVEVGCNHDFADGLVHEKTVPFAIIAAPLSGYYEITCDGRSATVLEGEAFVTPPNRPMRIIHRCRRRGEPAMSARWVHFSATILDMFDITEMLELPLKLPASLAREPIALIDRMLQMAEAQHDGPLAAVAWNQCVWRLLQFLCESFPATADAQELLRGPQKLQPLLLHLRQRLAFPMTTSSMASFAGLSPSHLHHSLKRVTGVAPMAYLKRLRLEEGARRLMRSAETISQVSLAVGFSNPFHFSREFRRQFRISPSEYRRLHRYGG